MCVEGAEAILLLNALTFDVEEWYHGNLLSYTEEKMAGFESRVEPAVMDVCEMLDLAGVKATFFFLGDVAARNPGLVRAVASGGHEIACHGWRHVLLYTIPEDEVGKDLRRAKALLEDISGQPVRGFRAPSWSVSRRAGRLLRLIRECGFEYDSSAFPQGTPIFGVPGIPARPVRLSWWDGDSKVSLIEFPPSVAPACGLNVPFGGGLFLRAWPYACIRRWIAGANAKGEPALVYAHPWELDTGLPALYSPFKRVARDFNLRSTRPKIQGILSEFEMGTMDAVLRDQGLYE